MSPKVSYDMRLGVETGVRMVTGLAPDTDFLAFARGEHARSYTVIEVTSGDGPVRCREVLSEWVSTEAAAYAAADAVLRVEGAAALCDGYDGARSAFVGVLRRRWFFAADETGPGEYLPTPLVPAREIAAPVVRYRGPGRIHDAAGRCVGVVADDGSVAWEVAP